MTIVTISRGSFSKGREVAQAAAEVVDRFSDVVVAGAPEAV